MADWKDNLLKSAMKAMSSPAVQKVMGNEAAQRAFAQVFKASYELKSGIDERKAKLARSMNVATSDDLRSMKRELDRLQRQVERMKREAAEQDEAVAPEAT